MKVYEAYKDEQFSTTIFLTFRSFASPDEFLDHLIMTYYSRIPSDVSEAEDAELKSLKTQIQLKYMELNSGF